MTSRRRRVQRHLDGTLSLTDSYSQSDWSYRMQQTIGDALDPGVKKKLINMMVKKAMDIFTEAVQQFVKVVVNAFLPMVWSVVRFFEQANHILNKDRAMIHSWENEGGALVHVR
jgi:hypothetical protein